MLRALRRQEERAVEKGRLLAFTDGVIAIIITIMVLELKVPHDASLSALAAVTPIFLSYVLPMATISMSFRNFRQSGPTPGCD
jgi:uncharacterized membrane protein